MVVRWTPKAAADLEEISDYLRAHHPRFREPTLRKLYDTIRALVHSPYRGRRGREPGTRELLFQPLPYIAVYQVIENRIEVLGIYHPAQDRQ